VLAFCGSARADAVWFDKPLYIRAATLRTLKARGLLLVNYVIDNPFGSMNEPGWRILKRTIPLFDLNLVPRQSSIADFRAAGAEDVAFMPLAFDPMAHFPGPGDAVKSVPLSFIGYPYEHRPRFIAELAATGLAVRVRGTRWRRVFGSGARYGAGSIAVGDGAWGDDYRQAIRESAICLAFVTRGNHETCAHKSFEITACGTFLLAERTDGHGALWAEGDEAVFFGSVAEAADKAGFYLRNERARETVARSGCRRTWTSGYSNDERLAAAFAHIDRRLAQTLAANARRFIADRRAALGIDGEARLHAPVP
jgi:spore maturation protein CgeB